MSVWFGDIEIPQEALVAIQEGVRRGDWITEMEYLGLPLRVINMLEESGYEINTLEDLLAHTTEELMTIDSLADVSVRQIMLALSQYHHLDEMKRNEEDALRLRVKHEPSKARQSDLRQLQDVGTGRNPLVPV
jgi:DNA-directed RNA polymerase alpha subunit